jgi:hypothetical protein
MKGRRARLGKPFFFWLRGVRYVKWNRFKIKYVTPGSRIPSQGGEAMITIQLHTATNASRLVANTAL